MYTGLNQHEIKANHPDWTNNMCFVINTWVYSYLNIYLFIALNGLNRQATDKDGQGGRGNLLALHQYLTDIEIIN